MSLDAIEIDGYDDHRCNAPGCTTCLVFQRVGESESQWLDRIREMWNAPEAIPVHGPPPKPVVVKPPPSPRTICKRGHPWTPPRCRVCKRDANNESRRHRRRQEAVA